MYKNEIIVIYDIPKLNYFLDHENRDHFRGFIRYLDKYASFINKKRNLIIFSLNNSVYSNSDYKKMFGPIFFNKCCKELLLKSVSDKSIEKIA